MALVDTELQRIVAGRLARGVGQTGFPGLDGRRVEGRASDTGLEEHGVDIRPLVLVEDADEIPFLSLGIGCLRPVEALQGGEPYGSYFVLGSLRRDVRRKQ